MKKYPKRQLVTLPTLRWELPEGINQLITEYATIEPKPAMQVEDDAPCSDEEAAAILGVPVKSNLSAEPPQADVPHRFFPDWADRLRPP